MVGKHSSRKKRAKQNSDAHGATSSSHGSSDNQALVPSDAAPSTNLPITHDLPFEAWTNAAQSPDPMEALLSMPDFNLDLPSLDLGVDHSWIPASIESGPASAASLLPLPTNAASAPLWDDSVFNRHAGDQVSTKAQYRHIVTLVEMIGSMESQIQDNELEVDKVLRQAKKNIASMTDIAAQQGKCLCKTLRALVPTAMELIVSLYENCLSKEQVDGEQMSFERLDSIRRRSSRLQFGDFPIEPKDQITFENQILTKELNNLIHTIHNLMADCCGAVNGNPNCGSILWYKKMDERANKLIAFLSCLTS